MRCCRPWAARPALNCALELERQGVLEEFGVTMIGATADAIDKAEDRRRFDIAMKKLVSTPRVPVSRTLWKKRWRLPLTWASRASSGLALPWAAPAGGIAYNREEFEEICEPRSGPLANQRAAD
ncbi:carbamoyl-phosphate synthase large chain [Salmonella enterica subsp. enterica serovar Typhimurium]|nr:carbamoyl-phosphate synthase large chain [Salmonella enterica subsp. enterica serovar Typhimurium]